MAPENPSFPEFPQPIKPEKPAEKPVAEEKPQPEKPAATPEPVIKLMLTQEDKVRLGALGFTEEQIGKMTPLEGADVIKKYFREKNPVNPAPSAEIPVLPSEEPSKTEQRQKPELPPEFGKTPQPEQASAEGREKNETAIERKQNKQIAFTIGKSIAGTLASIGGVKSFFDVPAWAYQRHQVRGVGGEGGLGVSVERALAASWKERGMMKEREEKTKEGKKKEKGLEEKTKQVVRLERHIQDSLLDLNRRLGLTREGKKRGSEVRKELAQLLKTNRLQEKNTAEERNRIMSKTLDNYVTTKVTGIQAARESLNTAIMWALPAGRLYQLVRPAMYGAFEAAERFQELTREARKKGESVNVLKDVFVKGVRETVQAALGKGKQERGLQKAVHMVSAWGKIARYVGMGAVAYNIEHVDDLLKGLEGKGNVSRMFENYQGHLDRAPLWHRIAGIFGGETGEGVPGAGGAGSPRGGIGEGFEGDDMVRSDELSQEYAAQEAEKFTHVEYQGGKSVWQEITKQFPKRYGDFEKLGAGDPAKIEALHTYNIDRVKDVIVDHPEKYGLPPEFKDFDRMTETQIKNIHWDQAFQDAMSKDGLTHDLGPHQVAGVLASNARERVALAEKMTAAEAARIENLEKEGEYDLNLKSPAEVPLTPEELKQGDIFGEEEGAWIAPETGDRLVFERSVEGYSYTVREYDHDGSKIYGLFSERGKLISALDFSGENIPATDPEAYYASLDSAAHKTAETLTAMFESGKTDIMRAYPNFDTNKFTQWGIELDNPGGMDRLRFLKDHMNSADAFLTNIFSIHADVKGLVSSEVIQKYIDTGLIDGLKDHSLSSDKGVQAMKLFEYPDQAAYKEIGKKAVDTLFGAGCSAWEKDGAGNITVHYLKDGKDVVIQLNKNGTLAGGTVAGKLIDVTLGAARKFLGGK